MEHVDLIVATRNRAEKLERMLASVPDEAGGKSIRINIFCDGDAKTAEKYGARVLLNYKYRAQYSVTLLPD